MTLKQIKQLHKGDEVFWSDPDKGKCSRTCKIQSIEIRYPVCTVIITEQDGSIFECFASELS